MGDHVKTMRLEEEECITSYDAKALFISVPVDLAIPIIKHKLQQHTQLHHKSSTSIHHIITLLEFCLKIPISSSKISIMNGYMAQPWVLPSVPIVANQFIEEFENMTINTAPNPQRLWLRYVDDTFVIQKAEYIHQFLQHIHQLH